MKKENRTSKAKYALLLLVLLAGCNADLYTKHLVSKNLNPRDSITLTSGYLEIKHASNKSASFGILGNIDENVRKPLLISLQLAGCVFLSALIFIRRKQSFLTVLPFVLVLAGAIGNAVDRVRLGYVVDFIYFHIKHHFHWPIFNVADILIVAGMLLLMLQLAISHQKPPPVQSSG